MIDTRYVKHTQIILIKAGIIAGGAVIASDDKIFSALTRMSADEIKIVSMCLHPNVVVNPYSGDERIMPPQEYASYGMIVQLIKMYQGQLVA